MVTEHPGPGPLLSSHYSGYTRGQDPPRYVVCFIHSLIPSLVRNIGTRSIFQTGLGTRLVSSPALVLSLEIQLDCYNVHVALLCWNSLSDQVCVWFVIFNPFPLFPVYTHTHTHTRFSDEFDKQKVIVRTRIGEMLRRPGFPSEISFAEVNCFDDKLVGALRNKIKGLIEK